jgi:hypothetical protein
MNLLQTHTVAGQAAALTGDGIFFLEHGGFVTAWAAPKWTRSIHRKQSRVVITVSAEDSRAAVQSVAAHREFLQLTKNFQGGRPAQAP